MVKKMMLGAMFGFVIGKLVVQFLPKAKVIDDLFGVNEKFFIVIILVLISIILFSIIPNKKNESWK